MNRSLKLKIIEKFDYQADFAQALNVDESIISRVLRVRRELKESEKLGKKYNAVTNLLSRLKSEGLVIKLNNGKYTIQDNIKNSV